MDLETDLLFGILFVVVPLMVWWAEEIHGVGRGETAVGRQDSESTGF